MQIILNGKIISTEQTTLEALLAEQGYSDCSVATAINEAFIAKKEYANTRLNPGCIVEVVAPMQGG
jgi:sulfur carrier protein